MMKRDYQNNDSILRDERYLAIGGPLYAFEGWVRRNGRNVEGSEDREGGFVALGVFRHVITRQAKASASGAMRSIQISTGQRMLRPLSNSSGFDLGEVFVWKRLSRSSRTAYICANYNNGLLV